MCRPTAELSCENGGRRSNRGVEGSSRDTCEYHHWSCRCLCVQVKGKAVLNGTGVIQNTVGDKQLHLISEVLFPVLRA